MRFRSLLWFGILPWLVLGLWSSPSEAGQRCGVKTFGNKRIYVCGNVYNAKWWCTGKLRAWYFTKEQVCDTKTCKKVWVWKYSYQNASPLEVHGKLKRKNSVFDFGKTKYNKRYINAVEFRAKWPNQRCNMTVGWGRANNTNNLRVDVAPPPIP